MALRPVEFHILLALAAEERHGYGILQEVAALTAGELQLEPGTLYRALHRMLKDGWVAESARDEQTKAVIGEIIACVGADNDRSGKPGVSQTRVEQFFSEAQAYSDWWKKAESNPEILPLGEQTASAAVTLRAVKAKVDDYFTRCQLAANSTSGFEGSIATSTKPACGEMNFASCHVCPPSVVL